ncbi:MAG: hypothetical protein DME24_07350 [Verrucomicrobia bacterium]|nr:MAG: hypothetical protein DME24_07350 [Verrucomicrobiota bacterium]
MVLRSTALQYWCVLLAVMEHRPGRWQEIDAVRSCRFAAKFNPEAAAVSGVAFRSHGRSRNPFAPCRGRQAGPMNWELHVPNRFADHDASGPGNSLLTRRA